MTNDSPLFAEFRATPYAEWLEAARDELGGVPLDQKLGTRTLDGLPVEPIYTRALEAGLPHLGTAPGELPFVRGVTPLSASEVPWQVRVDVAHGSPTAAGAQASQEVDRGATELALTVDRATGAGLDPVDPRSLGRVGAEGVSLTTAGDHRLLLKLAGRAKPHWAIDPGGAPLAVAAQAIVAHRDVATGEEAPRFESCADPLGMLARTGGLPVALTAIYDELAALVHWSASLELTSPWIAASSAPYHDAGAQVGEELGFTLAAGAEYLRALVDRGVPAAQAARAIGFQLEVGTRAFLEIAKLRAARLGWTQILTAYGCAGAAAATRVHASTSRWTETRFDPWVNIVRATVEAFAGVVGGATSVSVRPFDEAARHSDRHSLRLARNTHALLRDEGHVGVVADPAGGAYFVEALTDQVARRAWAVFQQIEAEGGLAAALRSGAAQHLALASPTQRIDAVARRHEPFVGVSRFPNLGETALAESTPGADPAVLRERRIEDVRRTRLDVDAEALVAALSKLAGERRPVEQVEAAIAAASAGATVGEICAALGSGRLPEPPVEKLEVRRGARPFERLRQAAEAWLEKTGARPAVLLASLGSGKRSEAKVAFVREALETVGIVGLAETGLTTAGAIADARAAKHAQGIGIVPADETSPEALASLVEELRRIAPDAPPFLVGTVKISATKTDPLAALPKLASGTDLVAALEKVARDLGVLS